MKKVLQINVQAGDVRLSASFFSCFFNTHWLLAIVIEKRD